MAVNGQGKSSDIFPHESESIPTVEEFGVRGKEIADEPPRSGSVVEFFGPEVVWESLDRIYEEGLNAG